MENNAFYAFMKLELHLFHIIFKSQYTDIEEHDFVSVFVVTYTWDS